MSGARGVEFDSGASALPAAGDESLASELRMAARVDDLLIALSTAGHSGEVERQQIRETVAAIASGSSDISGSVLASSRQEALRMALLVAMRRRNHQLSQAPGEGAGERDLLRVVMTEALRHDPEAVSRLLPLVPSYGSWREMLVLGEAWLGAAALEGRFPSSGSTSDATLPPEVAAVCDVFAEQLRRDQALLEAAKEGSDNAEKDSGKGKKRALPSNAAKYAPHPNRHRGKKSKKEKEASKDDSKGAADQQQTRLRWLCKTLANAVAERVFGGDSPTLQADYRRLRADLNRRLTEAGHLVEPLLPSGRLQDIDFAAAPSGSLKKYSKAIKRNHEAMQRWRRAMATSHRAVPALDNLFQDAEDWLEEDSVMREVLPMAVEKAVAGATQKRTELQERAVQLLEQITSSMVDAEELAEGSRAEVLIAVSTSGATQPQRAALLLAALLAAGVQNSTHIAVDGQLVELPQENGSVGLLEAPGVTAGDVPDCGSGADPRGPAVPPPAQALEESAGALLGHLASRAEGSTSASSIGADLLFLCLRPPEPEEADLAGLVGRLQANASLRSLLLHRMRPKDASSFRPRVPSSLPPSPGDIVVDVCFLMDLTGSMGSWMSAAAAHLTGIMRELNAESKMGRINISFVGYRDYEDRGRVVVQPFLPASDVEKVVKFIGKEEADGGGDCPEDVISGFEAALGLAWTGHLRFMVMVADAPAHGYYDWGDDYPSGLCPDQRRDLRSLASELAEKKQVDLLFCRLNSTTNKMEEMFQEVYLPYRGRGYGSLDLAAGAARFRDALLGTLSSTLLRVMAPSVDIPGLQTFDGITLSSVMATCMSSLKQSVASLSSCVNADLEGGEEDAKEVGEEDDTEVGDEAPPAKRMKIDRRSDVLRLKAELESRDMAPVRLVLGLPVYGGAALVLQAATTLLEAGVSVEDMESKGYPPEIIAALKEAGKQMLNRL